MKAAKQHNDSNETKQSDSVVTTATFSGELNNLDFAPENKASNKDADWHSLGIEQVMARLKSSLQGLEESDANQRLELFGPNTLASSPSKPKWLIFLEQFRSPLIAVLVGCEIVTLFLRHYVDAGAIFCTVSQRGHWLHSGGQGGYCG